MLTLTGIAKLNKVKRSCAKVGFLKH
jgi:hypothetical protein